MNPIKIMLLSSLFLSASTSYAAFNGKEAEQLEIINHHSEIKLKNLQSRKDKSVAHAITLNPENSALIKELEASWDNMIAKKCLLETIESANTDAEIAEKNGCLIKEYEAEAIYFENMLP
ncbi:hypothetical protein [Xenorhabdus szentirmaii]|uniref:Lysozyme inhibitor LprI N-terminal domain-containing protein n=2 Tax=Xenorhabdus szentirmaii TaxID=290112 RepID=W1IWK2_9GAMM|nr:MULTISPECIES: hypothetical protein [Xenorhabdus]MBD2791331.1 hypothetical protein [Xenorhabdus sp. CUL]MBD2799980.1 hypothetical protein [Xenorhabdus sp. M]MBD2803320.1 hypothetical protein [Xenorhabdus sp. ZM]MBD2821420.1 hypothetical protein [Xenorhabdus sp. 42]MBD2825093.1 hypothetical protein [Xenorhabdus sp. 5]